MKKAFVYSGILSVLCFLASWTSSSSMSNITLFIFAIVFGTLAIIGLLIKETNTNN